VLCGSHRRLLQARPASSDRSAAAAGYWPDIVSQCVQSDDPNGGGTVLVDVDTFDDFGLFPFGSQVVYYARAWVWSPASGQYDRWSLLQQHIVSSRDGAVGYEMPGGGLTR
jgi:hypothetical protein